MSVTSAPESLRSTGAASSDTTPRRPRLAFDSRFVAPILITTILLVAHVGYGILEAYPKTLLAIGTSIITEVLLGLWITKKVPHLASAYISGISCGILVRSPEWWPYALAAMISITSKYVIRVNGRHLWNPSNLGIAALLFLAPQTVASLSIQWGNNLGAMAVIWCLGAFIVAKLRRLHICATYVASFFAFALLRAVIGGMHGSDATLWSRFLAEAAPITGPMYQLFIFFMITDPKSTVMTRKGQMWVVFGVAAMECVLRLAGNVHAPYYALFLVGPFANLLEIGKQEWNKRRLAPAQAVPV